MQGKGLYKLFRKIYIDYQRIRSLHYKLLWPLSLHLYREKGGYTAFFHWF